ncbi:D-alanyl-D-alanine carboxypeptidase family protein [Microbacterium sp.]|jgi:LAS superfamily LD-carboxypeptidase LdcB|uniref:D-alanyl-D-alanine carboxypeptidase family protein n=1 Tax=Microbacterium sp. TaxID=51671 RepID=UPI0037C9DA34
MTHRFAAAIFAAVALSLVTPSTAVAVAAPAEFTTPAAAVSPTEATATEATATDPAATEAPANTTPVEGSPQGDVGLSVDPRGTVQVMGWVFDSSDFGAAIRANVLVDGMLFTYAMANLPSDYLYAYGIPGRHAFWTAVSLAPGDHEVCVVYANVGAGADTHAPCQTVSIPARAAQDWPQGDFAVQAAPESGHLIVVGWAFDHSELSASIDVEISVDGRVSGPIRAGLDSSYLYAYGVPGRHAFAAAFPVATGDHTVCVRARDRAPGGDIVIGCQQVSIVVPAHNPEGSVQLSMNANGSFSISGYVFDRSNLGEPVRIAVFQNSTLTASPYATAGTPQLAAYGVYNKGVDLRLPPLTRSGPVNICVLGLNNGTGSNSWLACGDFDPRGTTPTFGSTTDPNSTDVLVNKRNALRPPSYTPPDLHPIGVRSEAASHLQWMFADAGAAGHALRVASGYRSYSTQVATYNSQRARGGQAYADTIAARPGHSEHQAGLAADIAAFGQGCDVAECFGYTPAGQWLAANAWRYGFIQRYPRGYTATTGYVWEPWHYRYVGRITAREMHDGGVATYEDYLGAPPAPTY